jgi:hypothetical protein
MSEIVARFSAEQTARFFGGGELGRPSWEDPETQAKQDMQRQRLRAAYARSVVDLNAALRELSPQTADRLVELWHQARNGDPGAIRLFGAMYMELLAQALI